MVKMIFSDFDNTMLNYYSDNNYFNDYQINILKRVQGKGIKFCIVTGRSVSFFSQFSNLMGVIDYIIGSNGACVYDVKRKKFIYQEIINCETLSKLISYSIDNAHSFLLNCLMDRYSYGKNVSFNSKEYIGNLKYDCEQMVLFFLKEYKDKVANSIEYFNDISVSNTTDWGTEYSIDINKSNVSKGNAIKWLCDKLEVDKNDTIAFGDGANDVSMFDVVGESFAVGNASNNIKSFADNVTLNCEDYGIYQYIENNLLK